MGNPHMVRALRLLRIAELLREQPRRASELAEELGVSQRTIERDLLLLQGPPFHLGITPGDSWLWYLREERRPGGP